MRGTTVRRMGTSRVIGGAVVVLLAVAGVDALRSSGKRSYGTGEAVDNDPGRGR